MDTRMVTLREGPVQPTPANPAAAILSGRHEKADPAGIRLPDRRDPAWRRAIAAEGDCMPTSNQQSQDVSQSLPLCQRRAVGNGWRRQMPRSTQGAWQPAADRRDPVDILIEQGESRIQDLLPVRYARMKADPFAFLRGAAAVMAADLGAMPATGLRVQSCGDCHLANFGSYATPEGTPVFDINDFDETLPAPFEWDVKRLATSLVVSGRVGGSSEKACRRLARDGGAQLPRAHGAPGAAGAARRLERAHRPCRGDRRHRRPEAPRPAGKAALRRAGERTEPVRPGGRRAAPPRIRDKPPLRAPHRASTSCMRKAPSPPMPRPCRKTGASCSTATTCATSPSRWSASAASARSAPSALLTSDGGAPLLLQIKEAQESVLAPFAGASAYPNHGQRVVVGQRMMQADRRHLPGLDAEQAGWPLLLRPPAEGLAAGRSRQPDRRLPALLRRPVRTHSGPRARPHRRCGRDRRLPGRRSRVRPGDRRIRDHYADQTEKDWHVFLDAIKSRTDHRWVGVSV